MSKFGKKVILTIFTFVISFLYILNTKALTIGTLTSGKWLRTAPNATNSEILNSDGLEAGAKVTILETGTSGNGCSTPWLKVKTSYNLIGYMCGTGITIEDVVEIDPNGDFETTMKNLGFSDSYIAKLKAVHEKHPTWKFVPIKTNLDWTSSLNAQSTIGKALIDGSDVNLRSKDASVYDASTDTYRPLESGSWYAASRDTVAYYMDPRNFINERNIFMFEELKYNSSYQTSNAITKILGDTYMPKLFPSYIDTFLNAANTYKVNPLHLASRVRQETSSSGSISTTGQKFIYSIDNNCRSNLGTDASDWNKNNSCGNNEEYSSLYNFFNIGAYGSYMTPAIRGLIWANGGFDGSVRSYSRPWKSPELAILGGSEYLASGYISKEQNTIYFERWNVNPSAFKYNEVHTHQYMTNVRAHASESVTVYNSYKDMNLLDEAFEFRIPIYNNMPGENVVPTTPDKPPQEIETPTIDINTIITGAGYKLDGNYLNGISIGKTGESVDNDFKSISSKASITVKDENGVFKSGLLRTGDIISVSNGTKVIEYNVVINGDVNGDGKISILDLLRVQKEILNSVDLTSSQYKAADTNKDGKVNVVDLLRVQKHILGIITIN